jgi:hypothetical protein
MTPFVPPSWLAALFTRDKFLRLAIELLSRLIVVCYRLQRVPVWRSFDGRVTPITRMRDGHLCNTIRMLERGPQARHPVLVYMRAEAERRGLRVYPYAAPAIRRDYSEPQPALRFVETSWTPPRCSCGGAGCPDRAP